MVKTRRNKKKRRNKTKKIYTKKDFKSGDGMLTSVWGPPMWHFLHTMSFNYPVEPTKDEKKHYKEFILSLKHVLPCKYCRMNIKNNLKSIPLNDNALKNRGNFSKWMYNFHEHINKMLNKKSGLTYEEVRERYEHFRARCAEDKKDIKKLNEEINKKMKEKGCVEPLYGKKSKCVLTIVPKDKNVKTFRMDKLCEKKRL
tara:strand:+ start:195 stop:791 length:597 start_codon:yes stop_codon:yes gene_type:complete